MQYITTGNRIAVENFTLGDLYTITFTNGTYINSACIGIGDNFVTFQRNEPELLFSLTMATAELVSSIELYAGGSGTNNYNDLTNKPQINGVELVGNKSLSDLGIQATISDLDTIRSGAAAGATAVQPAALADYQTKIDSSHKLDADLVDDTTATHKFATAAQLAQIGKNENNILSGKYQADNTEKTIDIRNNMTFVRTGYFNSDGEIVSANSHAIYSMSLGTIRYIDFRLSERIIYPTIALGKLTDIDGNTKQVFVNETTLNQHFTIENGNPTDILYIVCFSYQTTPNYSVIYYKDYISIATAYKKEIEAISSNHYYNCIDKPLSLSGKKLQFFGDSITWGYINANTRANPTYPDAVGTAFSATVINSGKNSATLSEVSGYPSIYTEIQANLDTTADVVFIAGGINDWQTGVNAATLSTSMDNIITYLSANYTGKVIFITPINHGGRTPTAAPTQTLDSVRKIITEKALVSGYSVIQGWEFPFPTENNNASYINAMYADKIHPTQTGYNIYAKSLATILA